MTSPLSASPMQSRRRFRRLNLVMAMPLLAAVGVLLVTLQAQSWLQALVLGVGLATALVAFERWTAGEILRVAIPCLGITGAVWAYGALVIDSDLRAAYYSLAIVGCLTVSQLPRRRITAAVMLIVYVAAIGGLGLVDSGRDEVTDLVSYVIIPTGLTVILTGLMFPNKTFYDMVAKLEDAREREAEIAVVRERMRFASDLHDIQGHTLHVVKLKIALANKLLQSDPERAERELREMSSLVVDTIAQTSELAHGQRLLNLSAELENARNLLSAAGIHVRVERLDEAGAGSVELLAQVLRETTTNILRHSRATLARIDMTGHSITIVNDGVGDEELPQLHGLAVLARRVAEGGGELTARLEGGRLRTAAVFPPRPDASVTDSRERKR